MSFDTKNKRSFKATSEIAADKKSYLVKPIARAKSEEIEIADVVPETPTVVEPEIAANEPAPYVPRKKKRFKLSLTGKKALSGWLFCLPFVIGILGIYLPIVLKSIEVGFHGSMGNTPEFTLDAFKFVFIDDGQFTTTVVDAIKDLIIQIPAIVIFSLFMAIILNQKMTGRTFFRAVFFLPVILSTGIIDAIDTRISAGAIVEGGAMDDNTGGEAAGLVSSLDMEMLLANVNLRLTLGKTTIDLVEIVTTLVNNIFEIVSRSGVQMLIFLSGLQSISPSIYESCQMEGATAWETFWKITLPMISPMILVNAIYTVVDLFTAADNRVMQGLAGYGGMFGDKNPGNFSAGIWVYTALVLVVIVVVALLLRTVVFYQRRD
ncbi:MAG: ABC transporter permease subunit [Clostridia bacterium]|nr:ABC transporter permease subunit [Clostridia bacterium]